MQQVAEHIQVTRGVLTRGVLTIGIFICLCTYIHIYVEYICRLGVDGCRDIYTHIYTHMYPCVHTFTHLITHHTQHIAHVVSTCLWCFVTDSVSMLCARVLVIDPHMHPHCLPSSVHQATVREGAAWYCERNFERVNASCEDMCDDAWSKMQGANGRGV